MIRASLYFSRTRKYRDQATALRYRAKKVKSAELRVEFEEVAKQYDLLAETVEGRAEQHWPGISVHRASGAFGVAFGITLLGQSSNSAPNGRSAVAIEAIRAIRAP